MYNSNYEEYMRNVLGYNPVVNNTYQLSDSMYEIQQTRTYEEATIEALYPEIYKIIYPMVKKVSMRIGNTINEEIVEKMTDEIYRVLEEEEDKEEQNKRGVESKTQNTQVTRRKEETRHRNYMLKDLIKILILRELIGRQGPGRPPMRPPIPPPPHHMPPMPPRPPRY